MKTNSFLMSVDGGFMSTLILLNFNFSYEIQILLSCYTYLSLVAHGMLMKVRRKNSWNEVMLLVLIKLLGVNLLIVL